MDDGRRHPINLRNENQKNRITSKIKQINYIHQILNRT